MVEAAGSSYRKRAPTRLWGRRCLHEQLQHIAEVDGATRRKM